MVMDGMPSIADIVSRFTGGGAKDAPTPAHEAAPAEPSGKGGTATDPNLAPVEPSAEEKPVEAAAAAPETKPAPAPKVEPKKDPASSRFAALTRKEKEIRQQSQEVEQRRKEFEAREQALKERESRWEAAKRRPTQALKELGFTYADVTADLLGNYKEPEVDPVDAKLKPLSEKWDKFEPQVEALTQEINKLKSELSAKEQRQSYQQAMDEIRSVVANNPESYELVSTIGDEAYDLVKDVIIEYWNENKKMLDYAEAAAIVEKYYENEYLDKFSATKKLKSRFPVPAAEPSKPSKSPKEAKEPSTLTNNLTSGSQAKVDLDKMSKQEAIAYLAKKLQFKETN